MRILHLSWRDIKNPKNGGAEVVSYEVYKRLAKCGYEVTIFCAEFPGSLKEEVVEGIKIVRQGKFYEVHKNAIKYYKLHSDEFDIVIDEYHGFPLFTRLYVGKPRITPIYEVAGEIWFKMWPFPISYIGFCFEKICLRFLRRESFVTMSGSTKSDLLRNGIDERNVNIIKGGTNLAYVKSLNYQKNQNQICFVGRICRMKGVIDLIEAVGIVAKEIPDIKLVMVGRVDPALEVEIQELISKYSLEQNIQFTGYVSEDEKLKILRESMFLVSCSVKEGWGLVVTEANSQGTPAITYNVAGFRESIIDNKTGFLVKELSPFAFASVIIRCLKNRKDYKKLQLEAYKYSKEFNWDNTANQFKEIIEARFNTKQPWKVNAFKAGAAYFLFSLVVLAGRMFDLIFKFK